MPRHLFGRLVLLLAGVLALNTVIGVSLMLAAARETTLQHTVRSLQTQLFAADTLAVDAAAASKLSELGIARSDAPPPRAAALPFARDAATTLAQRVPDRDVRSGDVPQSMIWISARAPATGWIGIPLLSLKNELRWSSALASLCSLALTFGAAVWYARSLVRPLRTLAAAAPGLAAGEAAPALPRRAAAEIEELATALDRAAADTRVAARERQLVLAGISHDMRTPLARLVLALELAGDAMEPAMRAGMAADLAELDAILDQFIAYVRDGRDEPGAVVDLAELIAVALAAQQRNGRDWQRAGAEHVMVYAKPLALRRAVDNLLENAVRHGAAPFEIELVALDHGGAIRVRDRGGGVADDVLPQLGQPFYRADAARSSPGSGLGLATVMRIAAWHGGSLRVQDRDGGGFEAELTLIAARA